jgi:hypothetical protein
MADNKQENEFETVTMTMMKIKLNGHLRESVVMLCLQVAYLRKDILKRKYLSCHLNEKT